MQETGLIGTELVEADSTEIETTEGDATSMKTGVEIEMIITGEKIDLGPTTSLIQCLCIFIISVIKQYFDKKFFNVQQFNYKLNSPQYTYTNLIINCL